MQPFDKRAAEGCKHFIHLMIAGGNAARREKHVIVKSLTHQGIPETLFHRGVALAFVQFVLVVVEQRINVVLIAKVFQRLYRGGKVIHFKHRQRNAPLRQRLLQRVEMRLYPRRLTRRKMVIAPLLRGGDKQANHPGLRATAGRRERKIIIHAEIGAKPDQMGGHKAPELIAIAQAQRLRERVEIALLFQIAVGIFRQVMF
nr:hypothetical protein [Atlantibacter sp.]